MSVKTIYKCDKCGGEQEKPDQFWLIGVTVCSYQSQPPAASTYASPFHSGKLLQVCRPCLEGFGVLRNTIKPVEAPKEPTVEELIVDLLARVGIVPSEG